MSLWTPDGERRVPRADADAAPSDAPTGPAGLGAEQDLTPEQEAELEAMATEMAEVRQQLASVPAAVVVANHAMGLYELAAIHLSQQPPNLPEAQVAIDGFGALVESLHGRLGADEQTLVDGLAQLRLAFVQLSGIAGDDAGDEGSA